MISTDTNANVTERDAPGQDSRLAAVTWLAAYLSVSGVILITGARWDLAALHAVLVVVALVCRGGPPVAGFLPLVAAPLLYVEVPALIQAVGGTYHDVMVQRWEQLVFHTQPSQTLASHFPFLAVSEPLHAGYLAYYVVIFGPALLLWVRGNRPGFEETVLALTVTCTLCWAMFVVMPVEGPRYLWPAPAGVPDGPFRRLVVRILESGSSRGAAFPSSHMAVSVAMAIMALKWQRVVGWYVLTVAIMIGLGAVYGGFHYGVDMVAGALTGGAVAGGLLLTANRRAAR